MAAIVDVTILGNRYKLKSSDNEARQLEELASLLDARMQETARHFKRVNPLNVSILTALQLAEELAASRSSAKAVHDRLEGQHAEELARCRKELEALRQQHSEELADVNASHQEELSRLNSQHADHVHGLQQKHGQEMAGLQQRYGQEIAGLRQKHSQEVAGIQQKHSHELSAMQQEQSRRYEALKAENEALKAEHDALKKDYDELMELLEET